MRLGQTSAIHFISNIAASLISFIAVIYFARILGSDTLGKYFLVIALLTWLKIAGQLGIGSAISKRLSEGDDLAEFTTAGGILICFSCILISVIALISSNHINAYVGADITLLLVFLLICTLSYSFINAVLKGYHLVHIQGFLVPIRMVTRSAIQIFAVFIGLGLAGMIVGYGLGWLLTAFLSLFIITPQIKMPKIEHFSNILRYAKFSWLSSVQSGTFNWIDVIVLGFFISSDLIGIYTVAWSVAIFLLKFSQSISSAIFPEISALSAEGNHKHISSLVEDAITFSGLILIPEFIGSLLIGDQILNIYGEEFIRGAPILTILTGGVLIYSYQKQILTTLNALDRPDLAFRVNSVFIVGNFGFNFILVYFYGWYGAAVATGLSAAISLVFGYWELRKQVQIAVPYGEFGKQWIAGISMGILVYAVIHTQKTFSVQINDTFLVFVLVCFGSCSYFLILFITSNRFRTTVDRNIPVNI